MMTSKGGRVPSGFAVSVPRESGVEYRVMATVSPGTQCSPAILSVPPCTTVKSLKSISGPCAGAELVGADVGPLGEEDGLLGADVGPVEGFVDD